ncbi:FecR domain-containing protein [Phenylobacterium sp. SCN 70-31]|uniref:FecR family protein n=1 Tax=Phenylobacterium sp. SCN 70-31 TaxID=1660129 RepID=UPI000868C68F|nr:FecR domain-containing protein [Phenylobacterium sp. SCN 70-31]ODT88336.1 MAG: hypothetical protein ABS78_06855 [Phenylobacterium sp. SCN 70-31]
MPERHNVLPFVDLAEIEAQAAAWLARLDCDDASEADAAAYAAWRAQSASHREAADRLAGLWAEMDVLGQIASMAGATPQRARRSLGGRWPSAVHPALAAAAGLLLAVIVAGSWYVAPRSYSTGVGQQRVINLSDGSTIQLNTDSRAEVRYTFDARTIRLIRGEAFFDVAPSKRRPFLVYAGRGVVRAVGTAFAVRLHGPAVEVTVTKGVVELTSASPGRPGAGPPPSRAMLSATATEAKAGTLAGSQVTETQLASEAAGERLAWRGGMLAFTGQALPEVVAEMSRYTDVSIDASDPGLRDVRVAAYFKIGEIEPMLEAFRAGLGVRVERIDAKRVRLHAAS